jgi:outer membrane immunogenic protein
MQYAQSTSIWKGGWTVGAGAEWAFLDSWSAKLEYLHYDLGQQDLIAFAVTLPTIFAVTNHWTTRGDIVRVGLNYKFGWGPVVAKY